MTANPVLQLRVVVEAEDYERAVAFYRDTLGLPEEDSFSGDGGAQVTILDADAQLQNGLICHTPRVVKRYPMPASVSR